MNKIESAIKEINEIKTAMVRNGNEIAKIVYSISDELNERNACRDFANKTGMSKASISKMVYAEGTRKTLAINDYISYNRIYQLKDIMCSNVAGMLNEGMTNDEIRNSLTKETETEVETETEIEETEVEETETEVEETETETNSEVEAKDIKNQIIDILSDYDIEKDDLKLIKSLLKSLK